MIKNTYEARLPGTQNLKVTVVAEAKNYDSRALIRYLGSQELVSALKANLSTQCGFYGHLVNPEATSLLDLDYALKQLIGDWVITESSKNTIKVSELPDGAIS